MSRPPDSGRPLTVLYDEDCGFCTALAAWLSRHGRGGLRHAPIGSRSGDRALRDLAPAERYASVHVIDERGRRWSGATALPVLARAVRGLGWTAAALELFPGPTRLGYELVTRHRASLSTVLGLRTVSAAAASPRSRTEVGTRTRGLAG